MADIKTTLRTMIPSRVVDAVRPYVKRVRFGSLRRTTPFSEWYGLDRGLPVDRWYIERFLRGHAGKVTGRVLEVQDADYTNMFGGDDVTHSEVLYGPSDDPPPAVTLMADLTEADSLPTAAFDCIILTQVLQFVTDPDTALANLKQALAPCGTMLLSVPCISQIISEDQEKWGEYWRFTSSGLDLVLQRHFDPSTYTIEAVGNPLTATAFLYGLASEELKPEELAAHNPDYEVIVFAAITLPD